MVAQLKAPAGLAPIIVPTRPLDNGPTVLRVHGFARNTDGSWSLTERGYQEAGLYQRMLLRYVIGMESRADVAGRYGFSERQVQSIVGGMSCGSLTWPLRARLLGLSIGTLHMNRSERRPDEIRLALQRVGARAADMLRDPDRYSPSQFESVALDLYILSGAWAEDEA